jgi:hypothetical protein
MDQADSVRSTPPLNTSKTDRLKPPAEPQDSLYFKTPVTPEEAFQAIGRLRKEARDEIGRLLNFLDSTDGHMEREPDLGWPERFGQCGNAGATDDREDDSELNEDGGDAEPDLCDEPSLGALEQPLDQTRWAEGSRSDREDDLAESGIGDVDGLLEQVGSQDWQNGGMT